jgi:hypothetical protein
VSLLDGEARCGANARRPGRAPIALLGPGRALSLVAAQPGARFPLTAGQPYGETPVFNGAYVD